MSGKLLIATVVLLLILPLLCVSAQMLTEKVAYINSETVEGVTDGYEGGTSESRAYDSNKDGTIDMVTSKSDTDDLLF